MAVRSSSTNSRLNLKESKNILLPLFAISIVLIIFFIVFSVYFSNPETQASDQVKFEPVVVGEFDTESIFVPIKPVLKGQQLKEIKFKKVKYPKHQIPPNVVKDINEHINSFTLVDLPAGLPINKANLTQTQLGSNPVAERIPEGMRAMTVKVDPASLVNGWAGPGSIVDITLLTSKKSMVLAERVRVLSTEKFVSSVDGAPAEGLPSTATILVNQTQALAISTGMPHGKLIFMLRNSKDEGQFNEREFYASKLNRSLSDNSEFKGYITVKGSKKSFALKKEGWVPIDTAPSGALTNTNPVEIDGVVKQ